MDIIFGINILILMFLILLIIIGKLHLSINNYLMRKFELIISGIFMSYYYLLFIPTLDAVFFLLINFN